MNKPTLPIIYKDAWQLIKPETWMWERLPPRNNLNMRARTAVRSAARGYPISADEIDTLSKSLVRYIVENFDVSKRKAPSKTTRKDREARDRYIHQVYLSRRAAGEPHSARAISRATNYSTSLVNRALQKNGVQDSRTTKQSRFSPSAQALLKLLSVHLHTAGKLLNLERATVEELVLAIPAAASPVPVDCVLAELTVGGLGIKAIPAGRLIGFARSPRQSNGTLSERVLSLAPLPVRAGVPILLQIKSPVHRDLASATEICHGTDDPTVWTIFIKATLASTPLAATLGGQHPDAQLVIYDDVEGLIARVRKLFRRVHDEPILQLSKFAFSGDPMAAALQRLSTLVSEMIDLPLTDAISLWLRSTVYQERLSLQNMPRSHVDDVRTFIDLLPRYEERRHELYRFLSFPEASAAHDWLNVASQDSTPRDAWEDEASDEDISGPDHQLQSPEGIFGYDSHEGYIPDWEDLVSRQYGDTDDE
jgi:hypothetical protein